MPVLIPEKIEVKLAFEPLDTTKVLDALGFDRPTVANAPNRHKPDEERRIYFFDTTDLALFDLKLILRVRQTMVGGDPDDATLKVRGPRAQDAAIRFLRIPGGEAKFEGDQNVGKMEIPSFSITTEPGAAAVAGVVAGTRPFKSMLGQAGLTLLDELVGAEAGASIQCLGPVRSQIWKWKPNGFAGKITAELWEVAGHQLLEISDKAPRLESPALGKKLKMLAPEVHQLNGSKTRFALERLRPKALT